MDEQRQPPENIGGANPNNEPTHQPPSPNDLSAQLGLDSAAPAPAPSEPRTSRGGLKLRSNEPANPLEFEEQTAGPPDYESMDVPEEWHEDGGAAPPQPPAPTLKALEGQQVQAPSVEAVAGKSYRTSTQAAIIEDDTPLTEQEEINEFNGRVSPDHVLSEMGFKGDAVVKEKGSIRIFCPIHHDQIRRSMSIDPETRTFQCSLKSCPGYKGGTLVDLYAIHFDVSPMEARRRLSGGSLEVQVSTIGLVDQAQELIEAGKYDEALPLLQKAVEAAPKNETTRCRLAALQLEMGLRDEGTSNYLIAAEDYGVRGELEKTLQIYNLLVMMSPNDYEIHEQMAYIAARLGNIDEAMEKLKWLCNAMIEADRLDQAVLRIDRMIELKPDNTLMLIMKAELLAANGHQEAADSHIAWAVQEMVKRGSLAGAYRVAEKGLEISPNNQLIQLLYQEVEGELTKQGLNLQAMQMPDVEEEPEDEDDEEFRDWIMELEGEMSESKSRRMKALSGEFNIVDTQDESLRTPPPQPAAPAPSLTPPPLDASEFLPPEGELVGEEGRNFHTPVPPGAEPAGAESLAPPPPPTAEQKASAPDVPLPPSADDHQPIPTPAAMPASQPTGELPIDDQRVEMARGQLADASSDQRMQMYAHLRQMYHDVKKSHEDGTLSDFEKKVIKDFYKSFCIAFKEKNAEAGGDTLLTKF